MGYAQGQHLILLGCAMRLSSLLAVFLMQVLAWYSILCAEPPKAPKLDWQAAFTVLSAENQASKLVLMLVTNDDAFHEVQAAANGPKPDAAQLTASTRHGWCAAEFHHTCQRILTRRPDLEDKISLQSVVAGTPSELSGGKADDSPKRVVLFVCDSTYHLLALSIGIPSADDLLTLIEDAQEVKTLRDLNETTPDQTANAIVQRNEIRLGRLWKMKLQQMVEAKKQDDALVDDAAAPPTRPLHLLYKLFSALQPTYNYDVQTRFGLTTELDARRLVILEQHSESRYAWCQAITPFIIGLDIQQDWNFFVELLWQQCAVAAGSDQTDFLTWFDEQKKTGPFVMAVTPPSHIQHLPWPPAEAPKSRRGTSWQTTHDSANEFPFRTITTQQLTALVRQRELKPITFFSPSMVRYLLVSPNNRLPQVIREQDPPARFWGLLRRAKAFDKSGLHPIQNEEIR